MKLVVLISVILLTTIGLVSNPPGLPQTASNSRLQEAFGTQKWGRTIQAVKRINGGVEPQSSSKLMLYKALSSHR
jgi:hypothetical protein